MPLILNGTTGVSGVDGTAGTPAVQGGDANTGTFYPAADTVGLATNGTERARVSSDGTFRVKGAGTAGSTDALQISGSAPASAMTLSASGNLGIGETSPLTGLTVKKTDGYIQLTDGTIDYRSFVWAGGSAVAIGAWSNHPLLFNTNNTERMRIDSSGVPMFNCTAQIIRASETFRAQLNAGLASFITSTATGPVIALKNSGTNGYMMSFNNASAEIGTISSSGSNVAYNTSSDYRLKENVQPMTGALNKIEQLNPVTFNWKADGSAGQGFIAHELQGVVPECVTGEKDAVDENGNPKYQGVDTSFLVATLTAAIKELSTKLEAAEARIAALEAK